MPINPTNGEPASCADASTWGTYDHAVEQFKRGGVDGIGFQLGASYVGVDLDKCRNVKTGIIEPWAKEIVKKLNSYTEISPSDTGLHILGKGSLPPGPRRKDRIEMYCEGRYFTVTGRHIEGTPRTVEDRSHELKALHHQIFNPNKAEKKTGNGADVNPNLLADTELIERARRAGNGAKFARLWAGDWVDYASQSEADLALCMMLAFWTSCDPARIDRLFRQSALYRDKWDDRHASDGQTYGQITTDKAIKQTSETWRPGGHCETVASDTEQADKLLLPLITINERQLRDVTADALDALKAANQPPFLFVRGGKLARVRRDEFGKPIIDVVGECELRARLARAADYVRLKKDGESDCPPPKDVVGDILGLGQWDFPPLEGIVEAPILRPDGTVLDEQGYDPSTNLLYCPADGLRVPAIPHNPSMDDIAYARALIDEAIGEFPFVDEASKANAFALLLTPVVRLAIPGLVPMACVDAPEAGTGKGLLVNAISLISTGRQAGSMSAARDEEEWRKRITSFLYQGWNFIVIDNVEGELRSSSLASALTAPVWEDRLLGQTAIVSVHQRAVWVANGNNLGLGGDIPRRSYWIRLDAKMSHPWKRSGFTHPGLIPWVSDQRGRLLAAALTIATSWFRAGKPTPISKVPSIGSYEGWAQTMGGILEHAGILDPGTGRLAFLGNAEEMYELADESTGQWEAFLQVLTETYSRLTFTARELRIPGQGGRDSEIDPVSIPKLIRSRFRDEVGQGFRF